MELVEEGLRNEVADTSDGDVNQSTLEGLRNTRDQRETGGEKRMEKELSALYKILCMVCVFDGCLVPPDLSPRPVM